jgi:hypothetical protein
MSGVNRRDFLQGGTAALLATRCCRSAHAADHVTAPQFSTADTRWQSTYNRALDVLAGNVRVLPRFDAPVLIEGANYAGVWLECGPHEGLVYRQFRPDVARNNHITFFALQREDGQFPANNKQTEAGFGQIQMVVPIAATAWELTRATGDDELLQKAYVSCSHWDDWLMRYRNTRSTGLVEGFSTFDTGHDNSPRWAGMPNQCPGKDARIRPADHGLPRLCPDLSATVYGGRVALAAMARALGKPAGEDQWAERAEKIRKLIIEKLYVPEDGAFYDLDANGKPVRIRSDVLSRVCGEHVVTQQIFESMWQKQLHNPAAFWAPYPLPSIALDDPSFVRPIPANSWGGASQALTALRAPRWLEHYGKPAELAFLMKRWCEAIQQDRAFRQQLDPATGTFTQAGPPGYSPAALVMVDFTWRLVGVREEQDMLEWNVRTDLPAARNGRFSIRFDTHHTAAMQYDATGATLLVDDRRVARIEHGTVRLTSDRSGRPRRLTGVSEKTEEVSIQFGAEPARKITIQPNQTVQM